MEQGRPQGPIEVYNTLSRHFAILRFQLSRASCTRARSFQARRDLQRHVLRERTKSRENDARYINRHTPRSPGWRRTSLFRFHFADRFTRGTASVPYATLHINVQASPRKRAASLPRDKPKEVEGKTAYRCYRHSLTSAAENWQGPRPAYDKWRIKRSGEAKLTENGTTDVVRWIMIRARARKENGEPRSCSRKHLRRNSINIMW